eukprot:2276545-Lingulodinium_polyedra.AAC.1
MLQAVAGPLTLVGQTLPPWWAPAGCPLRRALRRCTHSRLLQLRRSWLQWPATPGGPRAGQGKR